MYLSTLMIDTGGDPDRPRPGRMWLHNVYHVHQRLCMGFPSPGRVEADPHFLQPFQEKDFPNLRNPDHKPGPPRPSFLFRVDTSVQEHAPRTIILVQSERKPDWEYAFHNAPMFRAAPPEVREYNLVFTQGQTLRFRIRMNLSKKTKKSRDGANLRDGTDAKGRLKSKRVALTWSEEGETPGAVVRDWFAAKGARCGFALSEQKESFGLLHLGWDIALRPKRDGSTDEKSRRMNFRSALLEGMLEVTDAAVFGQTLRTGIGSAKAFGFGLLSVALV